MVQFHRCSSSSTSIQIYATECETLSDTNNLAMSLSTMLQHSLISPTSFSSWLYHSSGSYHASICRIYAGQHDNDTGFSPCQYHSTIIPYSSSIHLSITLYAYRKWQCQLRKCLPHFHPPQPPLFTPTQQQQMSQPGSVFHTHHFAATFLMFLISGLCPKAAVNCALLCYYVVSSSNFLLAFQDKTMFHPQSFRDSWTLIMGPIVVLKHR